MKVLVGGNHTGLENAIPDFEAKYPHLEFTHCPSRDDTAQWIGDADIYLGWLDRTTFLEAKVLKWIQSPSTGVNTFIDIPELVTSKVLLSSASGTHGPALAESVLGMIFAFTRGLRDAVFAQQRHEWAIRQIRPGKVELTGSTMGIIGFGNMGRSLAERAHAFGVRILATDYFPTEKPDYVEELWPRHRLGDVLRQSDYVVITVPLTFETDGLIGAEQLALIKPSAMLIGISRGRIINQDALADALRNNRLAAAALDVCDPEPLPADSELWDLENLLIAPHIAGGTQFERVRVLDIFSENLERFVNGDLPLRNQVDKELGF